MMRPNCGFGSVILSTTAKRSFCFALRRIGLLAVERVVVALDLEALLGRRLRHERRAGHRHHRLHRARRRYWSTFSGVACRSPRRKLR